MAATQPVLARPQWLRNAAVYSMANIANSAIPFLLLPLLTRVLTPQDYGMVALFTTGITAFGALVGFSVHGAVNVRLFHPAPGHAAYVGTALAILAASAVAVLVAVLAAGGWLHSWTSLPRSWLALAVAAAAAQFVINVRLVVWQARGQAGRYGLFQVSQTALNLALSLLLVLALKLGWEGRATGVAAALTLFAALALFTLRRDGDVEWRCNGADARDALRFGIPLVPHVIGSLLIAATDRLMVAKLMSVHDAGVYTAAMQIGLVIGVLADAVAKALNPWLYARLSSDDEAVKRRIVHVTYGFFGAIGLAALLFGTVAPSLLKVVGSSFRSNPEVVTWVALGSAFGGMYLMVVNQVFFTKRNEWVAAASLGVGVLNLAVTYALVERHGVVGAAQAYAGAQLLLFLLIWAIAARCRPLPWLSALRRRPAMQPAGA
jgi:O-antigen/teichoic acid export membrane protein